MAGQTEGDFASGRLSRGYDHVPSGQLPTSKKVLVFLSHRFFTMVVPISIHPRMLAETFQVPPQPNTKRATCRSETGVCDN